jgi:hypothetical protein
MESVSSLVFRAQEKHVLSSNWTRMTESFQTLFPLPSRDYSMCNKLLVLYKPISQGCNADARRKTLPGTRQK